MHIVNILRTGIYLPLLALHIIKIFCFALQTIVQLLLSCTLHFLSTIHLSMIRMVHLSRCYLQDFH